MKLKELRISQSLTQTECANYLGVSLRTYQNYENDSTKEHTYKYNYQNYICNRRPWNLGFISLLL